MGTLSDDGYELKSQNDYFSEEKELYQKIDPDFLVEPSTPDGLKIAHDAEVFAALDQLIKQSYDARDPNKATGRDLDIIRKLTGAERSLGTPTTATLTLTGTPGTFIPAGCQVKTPDEIVFELDGNVSLDEKGTGTTSAHCTVNGAIEISANRITQIVTVIGGWQTVTNRTPASVGTDAESDSVFRVKSARAVARGGTAQRDSLYGEIYAVTGVRKVQIYENKTNSSEYESLHNPYSLPPHSLAIVVDGGADKAVAQAIFRKLNPGCNLHAAGTKVELTIYSEKYRNSYDIITFSRPNPVEIKIDLVVADPKQSCSSAEDLQQAIRDAVIQYAQGELLPDGIGFVTSGFDIGETVPYNRIFTPINKVLGSYLGTYVAEMKVNDSSGNVSIAFNEMATFLSKNIKVTLQ